jgi:hypothetical protein
MPLPTGAWMMNSNGNAGTLIIDAVDLHGNLTDLNGNSTGALRLLGGLPSPGEIRGFWDEASQKLTFLTIGGPGDAYTGFLFQDQFRMPGITGSVVFTLAGYFESFQKGTADRPVFGWYAQIGVP